LNEAASLWYYIPAVGAGYAWANAYTGENVFTGEKLTTAQRFGEVGIGVVNVVDITGVAYTAYQGLAVLPRLINPASAGYPTFEAFKRALGPAGPGKVWHHLVEQRLAGWRFAPEAIHNRLNVETVSREVNQLIANYYSRIRPFTEGYTVRKWLESQSFQRQLEFGRDILNRVLQGKLLP